MVGVGKILVLGVIVMFFDKIPFLGKLPGDIHIKRENVEFYFPIVTSVVLSLVLSGILWIVSYFTRK